MHDTTRELIIVGASGLGKVVAWLATRLNLSIKGFLDDNSTLTGQQFAGLPVLGTIGDWTRYDDCQFLVALAAPRIKRRIVERMQESGSPRFATLIDPAAIVEPEFSQVGEGSIVCAGTIFAPDVIIGKHCVINKLCSIGHDVELQDYVTLASNIMLGGHVVVERGAEIGATTCVRQGLTIAGGVMVGMGSVVCKPTESNTLYLGSPARPVKSLDPF
ncbi:acetyltransferase [Pistricoccus aurantiacus]|uniref:Acetyltransferase n=1 Tax=Pistricoccus aurantiacus TaxID=1883414 RepID=A0A5B8SQG4_9GAMM|nr:acetyltransferase [Pistricoccus aurantiacus]QEA38916.1 acetyltransferase [Pistricoccus aurantiacus]